MLQATIIDVVVSVKLGQYQGVDQFSLTIQDWNIIK